MNNLAVVRDNVIPLYVISTNNNIKYNKDGSVKRTHNNKVSGVSSEVFAFRTKEELESVFEVLNTRINNAYTEQKKKDARRNKLLFILGMNLGLRASDLCEVKWNFFFNENFEYRDFYTIRPKKTASHNKYVKLFFNNAVIEAINEYISFYPIENENDYVFVGSKGVIRPQYVWKLVSTVAKEAGIEQNVGSHTLRKTFGYWHYHEAEDKDAALVILQSLFGHSSTRNTMRYIGLVDAEIADMFYSVEIFG